MNQEIKEKWKLELNSNKYKQGFFALRQIKDEEELHCPLGVLCELYRKEFKAYWELSGHSTSKFTLYGLEGTLAPPVIMWTGLKTSNPLLGKELITDLNDREKLTFKQISELIDKYL